MRRGAYALARVRTDALCIKGLRADALQDLLLQLQHLLQVLLLSLRRNIAARRVSLRSLLGGRLAPAPCRPHALPEEEERSAGWRVLPSRQPVGSRTWCPLGYFGYKGRGERQRPALLRHSLFEITLRPRNAPTAVSKL